MLEPMLLEYIGRLVPVLCGTPPAYFDAVTLFIRLAAVLDEGSTTWPILTDDQEHAFRPASLSDMAPDVDSAAKTWTAATQREEDADLVGPLSSRPVSAAEDSMAPPAVTADGIAARPSVSWESLLRDAGQATPDGRINVVARLFSAIGPVLAPLTVALVNKFEAWYQHDNHLLLDTAVTIVAQLLVANSAAVRDDVVLAASWNVFHLFNSPAFTPKSLPTVPIMRAAVSRPTSRPPSGRAPVKRVGPAGGIHFLSRVHALSGTRIVLCQVRNSFKKLQRRCGLSGRVWRPSEAVESTISTHDDQFHVQLHSCVCESVCVCVCVCVCMCVFDSGTSSGGAPVCVQRSNFHHPNHSTFASFA